MTQNRITSHPILEIPTSEIINFYWKNQLLKAIKGETIASALIANGYDIFGHHPKDNTPMGLFCANGQCSQCMVLVNHKPVKACMAKVKPDDLIMPMDTLPDISYLPQPEINTIQNCFDKYLEIPVLIIGGGPAGLSAAIELGKMGIKTLMVDDKSKLGGKLILQTHRFFGSTEAVYAGTRGNDIAQKLASQVENLDHVVVWPDTIAVGVYEDKTVGLWRVDHEQYTIVKPDVLLVASGARERSLAFKGNTLPGIYGAGAFQTLVNRDLVRPSRNLFIVGGGNVGLIAGYHALQAGINVVGLIEVMPQCGGYKVHEDKLARLNVPIINSHTIIEAKGKDRVQSVIISKVNESFKPIPGSEQEFPCDCILIAVGLDPVDEFAHKANEVGLSVFSAGDAAEIAEASSAMFSGKIKGFELAKHLGVTVPDIPEEWHVFEQVLKSHPGKVLSLDDKTPSENVFPVIHCRQEIPCDPCENVCPYGLISINHDNLLGLPQFRGDEEKNCIACGRCVAICPGLAITLVDLRLDKDYPIVSIPLEFSETAVSIGDQIPVTDIDGMVLGNFPVLKVTSLSQYPRTRIIEVKVPINIAAMVSGIQLTGRWSQTECHTDRFLDETQQETIICRCEHISADTIRDLIRQGVRDINQIKAITKATMGSCGGKTCLSLIRKLFREAGLFTEDITEPTQRPVFVEVPVEVLARNNQEAT